MSTRPNAPYRDEVLDNGKALIYEGHDVPRSQNGPDPKSVDQPLYLDSGRPTQNGYFFVAAQERGGSEQYERVYVYEKIKVGIWVYNGCFALRSAWIQNDGVRSVCKFRLELIDDISSESTPNVFEHSRMIPSAIKQEVWKRDQGQCQSCGSKENLHFDHIIPYSKGGTSFNANNIQLLCAKHNLSKSAKIE